MKPTSSMTIEDWKTVEKNLRHLHYPVELNCDGYPVTLVLERVTPFKNGIAVYIDGTVKGSWIIDDCEERRRFMRPITKQLFTRKQLESAKKVSKKYYRDAAAQKYTYHDHRWYSFGSLKRHLIKNNEVIEITSRKGSVAG
ncbi:hypothetical protein WJ0W_005967 [Paenibacillus melissococcoides]|uniref:Phage protein n=2 Tax=Paenibacillus melissococcoides TaxID=2912268 RepID=A0ABM9G242_9BACL|nr:MULTISPECIES: hypothetical protein [Paenibacillus]MEB9896634.1 hypothetical protein [Bacillus cereus]CAH8245700.1 hypothetical protein WJ0W_002935 [Paenibacillus melissococcoides]CAH8248783.1 hypothetical protein WJ0W_005967 [Paenibacillus melissococcoides]CAH8711722.1 hypothetical protein WDD9_003012 [Paenibacillus melissococcoides]CAH8712493.1 hypothetical protein HTL2_003314 [Paenibacillus melissococcoides]